VDGTGRHVTTAGWSLSLVIPAYNEEAGICQAVEEADNALSQLADDYEILVVDDGSNDNTPESVNEFARSRPHVHLLQHVENQGYGAALRTGFQAARFDRVAFTDADCQFYLADLASLVPLTHDHDLAVGYRVGRQDPWPRRFFSWGYNRLIRALLGTRVRDCDCALKVFRKKAVASLLPQSRGFFVNTEMLTRARQLGYGVAEAGVRHRPRLRGTSKVSLWDIPRTLASLLPFWWSQVLFPGSEEKNGTRMDTDCADSRRSDTDGIRALSPKPRLSAYYFLIVLVAAGLMFFSRLGCPLQEPEEPRYAEIARQMLATHSYTIPVLHGLSYYDKPPLLYWLVMASFRIFGIHDWSARLVSAGAAFLTVLVIYWWGRRALGPRAGFMAAMILCLSPRFVFLGRLLTMNSLLCLWVVAALAAAHVALSGPRLRKSWWLLSAAACALGLLTKGPVALALVTIPLIAYQLLDARSAKADLRAWLSYLAVSVGLASPWYLTVAVMDPSFAGYFFWKHNLVRYVAPFDHAKPIWFYLGDLFLGMLPWSLLLPSFVKSLGSRSERQRRPAALGFLLLAAVWCLVFYSLAGSKRAGYILPAMPLIALVLGCYLDLAVAYLKSRPLRPLRARYWAKGSLQSALFVLGIAALGSLVAMAVDLVKPTTGILLAAASLLALAGVSYVGWSGGPLLSWKICGIATFVVVFIGLYLALPGYARRFSLRGPARQWARLPHNPEISVICYPRRWDSISFYLQRNDVRVYTPRQRERLFADLKNQSQTLAFIKSDESLNDLVRELPRSMEFVPQGRQGYVAVGWIRRRLDPPVSFLAGW
jgi:dolichol-phosphate mannosyltransferase